MDICSKPHVLDVQAWPNFRFAGSDEAAQTEALDIVIQVQHVPFVSHRSDMLIKECAAKIAGMFFVMARNDCDRAFIDSCHVFFARALYDHARRRLSPRPRALLAPFSTTSGARTRPSTKDVAARSLRACFLLGWECRDLQGLGAHVSHSRSSQLAICF